MQVICQLADTRRGGIHGGKGHVKKRCERESCKAQRRPQDEDVRRVGVTGYRQKKMRCEASPPEGWGSG